MVIFFIVTLWKGKEKGLEEIWQENVLVTKPTFIIVFTICPWNSEVFSFLLYYLLLCLVLSTFLPKFWVNYHNVSKVLLPSLSRLNEYFLRGTQLFVTRGTLQNSYKWAVTPAGSPVVTPAGDKSDVEFVVCADKCQARLLNGLCCPEANRTRGERPINTADR